MSRIREFRIPPCGRDLVREEDAVFASMLVEGGIDVPEGFALRGSVNSVHARARQNPLP
jgi:hypothetical protein